MHLRSLIIFLVIVHLNQSVYVSIRTYEKSLFFHTWLLRSDVIQPDRFEHMEIYSMYFHPLEPYEIFHQTIKTVKYLLNLELLYISNFSLTELPVFEKLPKLRKLAVVDNEITELKNTSFKDILLTDLFLSGNKIQRIEDGTFQANLKELYLNCNNLSELSSKWFVTPGKLGVLNVLGNFITHLRKDALADFLRLQVLDLSFNKMIALEAGSLDGPTLIFLSLAYNNLTVIPENVFEGPNNTIEYLDVTYNRLTFLKEELLEKLNLQKFEIRGNPWQCPCYNKIEQWMMKKGIMMSEFRVTFNVKEEKCITAQTFAKFCIELYDDELYKLYASHLEYDDTRKNRCGYCNKFVLFIFYEMKGVFTSPPSKAFNLVNF